MKASRLLSRTTRTLFRRQAILHHHPSRLAAPTTTTQSLVPHHNFSTTRSARKGLQPHTSDPEPRVAEPSAGDSSAASEPAGVTDSEYHELADQYLNDLLLKLENKANDQPEYEVEYSAGVMTLSTPKGTYVINKQPPNKQIWLSSPVSGPKRFDWVVAGGGQEVKEGTETVVGDDGSLGGGKWVYLRDGVGMTELLKKEVEVEVAEIDEGDTTPGRAGPGGSG